MGCASSTEVIHDPITGEKKQKKKLGGAYPGQRPPQKAPYMPAPSQFQNGQATAHFIQYGGGNALVLQDPNQKMNGIPQPESGAGVSEAPPKYIQVTLPAGVKAGDTIRVAAPDGRLNEIIVPNGMGPGSTFTVEFADGPPPAPLPPPVAPPTNTYGQNIPYASATAVPPSYDYPTPVPPPSSDPNADDGFASGFNNPNYTPSATASPIPSASAYPAPPSYTGTPSYK